jgi:hypothetical protein
MSNEIESSKLGFERLLHSIMRKRWMITAMVLGAFILIVAAIFTAIELDSSIAGEWKELLLLMLGAFIGSYGKIIDYWFSDNDKDKILVQKMDEEDGIAMSKANDFSNNPLPITPAPIVPEPIIDPVLATLMGAKLSGKEIDEDNDGTADGLDYNGDGKIDEYFAHRQCDHIWGDSDQDGDMECLKCGKIMDVQ